MNHDPRIQFAAERTLLAWLRTGLSLMAFGFLIERFGLLLEEFGQGTEGGRIFSFVVGLAFILAGSALSLAAAWSHRRVIEQLPEDQKLPGYHSRYGLFATIASGLLGVLLCAYLVLQL
ncbi:MAG: DUF202 domain-containing protein [Gammaproteobacteria bacterium]|nr:MAG: DUF202 domain-containing protein [Gammaproteobacteria bacterium]